MNRAQADLNEANIRIKRWLRAVETMRKPNGQPMVLNPGKPEVRTSQAWPHPTRWRVFEQLKWTLDGTADGAIVSTECCVASASSAPDVLLKYTLWAQDPARTGYFRDRDLRGEDQRRPPLDPPEWAAQKAAQAEAVNRANENATEWVKKTARGWMKHVGFDDPVRFELAWQEALKRGLVRSR